MKKTIIILCAVLTAFSLTAIGYINWSDSDQEATPCSKTDEVDNNIVDPIKKQSDIDLVYEISSRFIWTVTKDDVDNAESIVDVLPEKATKSITSYQSTQVKIYHDDKETIETGYSDVLNAAQKQLLKSTDYSTNMSITADYQSRNAANGLLESGYLAYAITIVPKKEAAYIDGNDALIDYLRQNSKEATAIIEQDQLQPGRVNFTVTKEGTIANVKCTSTSGYPSVDQLLCDLVNNMPGKWEPAKNANGEHVDQELIFFFGLMGC